MYTYLDKCQNIKILQNVSCIHNMINSEINSKKKSTNSKDLENEQYITK